MKKQRKRSEKLADRVARNAEKKARKDAGESLEPEIVDADDLQPPREL